ncbi:hypothetical protein DdX_20214 [Ditylenchus destructor]|uniref:Phosphotyrosine protein phosphatase I domain-containing protein n=1 Tax=Ditylenchus destructor TaxID=166010 RepID=A0AAD4MJ31_9BILA|nr:hypothetical protein DdX_20214 [Ditylenchus destructor]
MHKARATGFDVEVDSAAISDEERGNPPDRRSVAEAKRRGHHDARSCRAASPQVRLRSLRPDHRHDRPALPPRCAGGGPAGTEDKIHLFTEYAEGIEGDVPDPWYGGQKDFIEVFDLIDHGVAGLLAKLRAEAR